MAVRPRDLDDGDDDEFFFDSIESSLATSACSSRPPPPECDSIDLSQPDSSLTATWPMTVFRHKNNMIVILLYTQKIYILKYFTYIYDDEIEKKWYILPFFFFFLLSSLTYINMIYIVISSYICNVTHISSSSSSLIYHRTPQFNPFRVLDMASVAYIYYIYTAARLHISRDDIPELTMIILP